MLLLDKADKFLSTRDRGDIKQIMLASSTLAIKTLNIASPDI